MTKRILIDGTGGNLVACLAEGDKLLEFQTEKKYGRIVVGSIYHGKVENVLGGMQAAFVNIGLEKNGYLYMGEADKGDYGKPVSDRSESEELPRSAAEPKVGDDIIVQVVKDASGTKGCRLTTNISFAGRNLVYMPFIDSFGVSRKVTHEEVREKLSEIVEKIKPAEGGFIVRTAAQSATEKEILDEAEYLVERYEEVKAAFERSAPGTVLYEEGDLARRALRDVYTDDVSEIVVADRKLYDEVLVDARKRRGIAEKVIWHDKPKDIFAAYGLQEEIDNMLRNKVYLASGAYINIDKTEALTAIDVNTGKYVGEVSLEETVFETNLLAAAEIARQLRLRNIAGIIIIDFIDMDDPLHRQAVVRALEEAVRSDRTKCTVLGMTELGLVEMTRKKQRRESTAGLTKNCPYCKGEGVIFSNDYIVMKIRVALLDVFAEGYHSAIIETNSEIADYIIRHGALSKDITKTWRGKRIYLVPHKTYHQEYFVVRGDNSVVLDLPDKAKQLF